MMTESQTSNALGVVLLLAALIHAVATVILPFIKCRQYRHGREV